MMQYIVGSDFNVIPERLENPVQVEGIDGGFVNLNPQCGPFPFGNVYMERLQDGSLRFVSELTDAFALAQIVPRGRPHFSLVHQALVDDAIASVCDTALTGEPYGETGRYIEMGVVAKFHREAFLRGTISTPRQMGTVFVDGFRCYWTCVPDEGHTVLQKGMFRVAVVGESRGEEIQVVSLEGQYFRRKAVRKI